MNWHALLMRRDAGVGCLGPHRGSPKENSISADPLPGRADGEIAPLAGASGYRRFRVWTGLWLASTLVLGLLPHTARADCPLSSNTVTCTGDLSGGLTIDASNDDFGELVFKDLTADTGSLEIENIQDAASGSGDDGAGTSTIAISFDGSSAYGIDSSTGSAFTLDYAAGDGSSADSNDGTADDGGDGGGAGGESSLTFTDTTDVTGVTGIDWSQQGGDGGTGGEGKTTVFDAAHGGDGGDGGNGGGGSITADSGDLTSFTSISGELIYMHAQAGDGGDGGEGKGEDLTSTNVHGGDGGDGGDVDYVEVTITTTASATVATENISAIRLESLGGQGGDGGDASGSSSSETVNGGDGGAGGAGGTVTLDFSTATIKTTTDSSLGILVRSYGGAGGDGGSSTSGYSGSGGGGAAGGVGGAVTLTFEGSIETSGTDASGILMQSVGGFAGDAGSASDLITYGASSESGGEAGKISGTLVSGSIIKTSGEGAAGFYAQSVGGGGGKGSDDTGLVSLGGSGSAGGDGGEVDASLESGVQITTEGDTAPAFFVQSFGGGGGSGGSSEGLVAIGGSAGSGGDAGKVTATIDTATLSTSGAASNAVILNSSGGGGGLAYSTVGLVSVGGSGGDGGSGSTVQLTLDASTIKTTGEDSDAIFVQSVGGGGGSGASAVSVGVEFTQSIGGSGGSGGSGDDITIEADTTTTGTIVTTEDRSRGVVAQSIGGGGGGSGNDLSYSAGFALDISIGQSGDSGDGNTAGDVTIKEFYHSVQTSGDHAHGVLAQSVGGGGGSVGTSINYTVEIGDGASIGYTVGGSAGTGGDAGTVSVTLEEDVTTGGDKADAVFAQSVGGGGGNSGTTLAGSAVAFGTLNMTVGGSGGSGGNGDTVTVSTSGNLATGGSASHGILAQSIGGGGGTAGWTSTIDGINETAVSLTTGGDGGDGGTAGDVTVTTASGTTIKVEGDTSVGIKAQSVGGSGGDTDATVSGDIDSGSYDFSFNVGGDGGGAGDSGNVVVTNYAEITTQGDTGYGIFAQSVPNSGGSSGFTVDASLFASDSLSFNVSGSGGDGGDSGYVEVFNYATISTSGDNAIGILAQANGSGGGTASGSVSADLFSTNSISVAVGGNGGTGGSSYAAEVQNTAEVKTEGAYATAILAQAQGGSGGNGGLVVDGGFNSGSEVSLDAQVNIGGTGGSGATGGTVSVTNSGTLSTSDYEAFGIVAQSIGGSGGNGGSVYSGVLSFSSGSSVTTQVSIGGDGGDGGGSGNVGVTNSGKITTQGYGAGAIFAQSVGGSGGSGGSSFTVTADSSSDGSVAMDVTVGGSGGGSSTAGFIEVYNSGVLETMYGASHGILAQSVGGNGGSGGAAGTILMDRTSGSGGGTVTITSSINVGGSGGDGGLANTVYVENDSTITTNGDVSYGIYAQSVGGGGGDGGEASAFTFASIADSSSDQGNSSFSASIAVGGTGGSGGDADWVQVKNTDTISTAGIASYGIFAQSVGGGGGNGGNGSINSSAFIDAIEDAIDSGDSSDAESAFEEDLATFETVGENLYNTFSSIKSLKDTTVQSLLTSWQVDVGGSGGTAGAGSSVTVDNEAEITTTGDSGTAIFAQSVGGGGGNGGDGTGSEVSQINISGDAGSGSDGGDVTVTSSGEIMTSGIGAMGIFAQSVGGGGGTAGDVELAFKYIVPDTFGLGVSDSGDGGKGGDGGAIQVETTAPITTTGEMGHGIWAQSVGGSGGASGTSATSVVSVTGSGGASGDGGTVYVEVGDAISVTGDTSVGVFAQSVSGDYKDSTSATVQVDVLADITATGTDGRGVVVQSDGYKSSDTVTVNLQTGSTISAGSGSGDDSAYGILVLGGSGDATLSLDGTIEMSDIDSYAVQTMNSGSTTIELFGTLHGSVSTDYAANLFLSTGGLLESGSEVNLGAEVDTPGYLYLGGGTLSPGGEGTIATTDITAIVTPNGTASTVFLIDLEMGASESDGTADRINLLYDDTQELVGEVEVNLVGTNTLSSGEAGSVVIASADGSGAVVESFLTVESTSTVTYSVMTGADDDGFNATLFYIVDYTPDSTDLSLNQSSVGDYVSTLAGSDSSSSTASTSETAASDSSATPLAAAAAPVSGTNGFIIELTNQLLNVKTVGELKTIYDLLAPGEVFATAQTTTLSSLRFSNKLHSCPQIESDGAAVFFDEGSCLWGDFYGVYSTRAENPNAAAYDETVFGFAFGGQQRLESDWILGGAVSYERSHLTANDFTGKGHRVQAGAVVKKEFGATTLAGSFSGGFGTYDSTRTVYNGISAPVEADSSPSNYWIAAHGRVSHSFEATEAIQIKPYFDVGVWQFWQGAYDESSSSLYALEYQSFSKTSVTANPMVEVQTAFDVGGVPLDASMRAGVLGFLTNRQISSQARFHGVGPDGPWFGIQDDGNRIYGQIGAALKGQITRNITTEASFGTLLSDSSYEYIGAAKLNLHF